MTLNQVPLYNYLPRASIHVATSLFSFSCCFDSSFCSLKLYLLCRITNAGLPSGLARLPYLKSIGLKRNCLTSVPRMLGQMQSLQEIYLEDNNDLEV